MLCEIAAERGLMVDMHCDETDDPLSRHIETLAAETQRLGPARPRRRLAPDVDAHRWTTTMSRKLLPLIAEAGVAAIANPLINITLQGRHDTYPEAPRHDARAGDDGADGITVAFGHDCVMDPWYSWARATCSRSRTWPSTSAR